MPLVVAHIRIGGELWDDRTALTSYVDASMGLRSPDRRSVVHRRFVRNLGRRTFQGQGRRSVGVRTVADARCGGIDVASQHVAASSGKHTARTSRPMACADVRSPALIARQSIGPFGTYKPLLDLRYGELVRGRSRYFQCQQMHPLSLSHRKSVNAAGYPGGGSPPNGLLLTAPRP